MEDKIKELISQYMMMRDKMIDENKSFPHLYSEAEIEWVDSFIYTLYKLLEDVDD